MLVASFDRVWFLTWTTYGTWLPGDDRGFVSPKFEKTQPEERHNIRGTAIDAGRPALRKLAHAKLKGPPVLLTAEQANCVAHQFRVTAEHRNWTLVCLAVMSNHAHLLVGVQNDPDPGHLMRDFKAYGSRALNECFERPQGGTWWTEQGSKRLVREQRHFDAVRRYIRNQHGALVVWEME